MKYMLLIYHDEQLWSDRTETEKQEIYKEYRQLIEELQAKGIYLVGDQLQPSATGQTVRVRDGQSMVTDGPFAETREQLGGFFFLKRPAMTRQSRSLREFHRRAPARLKCGQLSQPMRQHRHNSRGRINQGSCTR